MKITHLIQLANLIDVKNPTAVIKEVEYNFIQHYPKEKFLDIRIAFEDFNRLMDGKYPGYRACNTKFHDKLHTLEALLAVSRLVDGYNISKKTKLPLDKVKLLHIATIFHDSGYIQTKQDKTGTGAKYTLVHVERSINFIKKYFQQHEFSKKDFVSASNMIRCTGLKPEINKIKFNDKEEQISGYILGTGDLLGQMSSRVYLEKLLYLYQEFIEGNVSGYESEFDLVRKTLDFYKQTMKRLDTDYNGVYKFATVHFKERYGINTNLYIVAIERQMNYLKNILSKCPTKYKKFFRRKI